jgi:mono/diheme cytochrome c family protein
MFKRIVNAIEVLALIGAVVFLVLLFANEPESGSSASSYGPPGAALFVANCAACHGSDGGGGTGLQLSNGKVRAAFPDVADEIKVVTNGRNGMPAFGSNLSADEISLVVEYTRSL